MIYIRDFIWTKNIYPKKRFSYTNKYFIHIEKCFIYTEKVSFALKCFILKVGDFSFGTEFCGHYTNVRMRPCFLFE